MSIYKVLCPLYRDIYIYRDKYIPNISIYDQRYK